MNRLFRSLTRTRLWRILQDPFIAFTLYWRIFIPTLVLSVLSIFVSVTVNDFDIIALLHRFLLFVGLSILVPSTQISQPFRFPVLLAMVGLSAANCFLSDRTLSIAIVVLSAAFMLLPPNDPPDDTERKGEKVRREQLRWTPEPEGAA